MRYPGVCVTIVLAAAEAIAVGSPAPGSMPIVRPPMSSQEARVLRIVEELRSYVPDTMADMAPAGAANCQADKISVFARAFSRTLRCHRDAAMRGAEVDPECVNDARVWLEDAFAMTDDRGQCATHGDAKRVTRLLARGVGKIVAVLRPGDDPSTCAATKLEVTAAMERRVLVGYAASRRSDRPFAEPLDWSYRLRRRFASAEERSTDCTARGGWRTVVRRMVILHDQVIPALWPAPSLGVAYWRRLGFRVSAREVTTRHMVMDDFGHAWFPGGFPEGGAEIEMWSERRPIDLIHHVHLSCLESCTSAYVRVSGKPGMRAEWSARDVSDMRRIVVWVADGHRVRGFALRDYEQAATAARHRAAFDTMLETVELD